MKHGVEEFPNFTYVTSTLEQVHFNDNKLTTIPANLLDILVKLRILSFVNNFLTSIPDVAGPGATLRQLFMQGNQMVEFPSLKKLGRSLSTFSANDNSIKVFDPNNIGVGNQSTLEVQLERNEITSIAPMIISSTENFPTINIKLKSNPMNLDYKWSWVGNPRVSLYRADGLITRGILKEAPGNIICTLLLRMNSNSPSTLKTTNV